MAKLDRLGWAAGLVVTAYGVRIGVRTNRPDILDRVAALMPPGSKPAAGAVADRVLSLTVGGQDAPRNVRRFHLLYSNALQVARTHDLDEVFTALEDHVKLYVAENAPRLVFVHAGVVGWRGRAIVLPGVSFAGKSTLVAALVKAGATYHSDEYAVLDTRGRVHPFACALRLRADVGAEVVPAETLGEPAARPLPVGLVAALAYRPDGRWRPRRLSPGRALLELLRHTVPARTRPRDTLAALRPVAASARVVKGARGAAAETAQALLEMLDRAIEGRR
jgi:hypothetical protein